MIKRLLIVGFLLGAGLFSAARPAAAFTEAGEAYVYPTFAELTQTTILLGGMDIRNEKVLEDYIALMYCDLYKENYSNDFSWHGIKKQILSRVTTRKEYYRSLFQLGGVVQLGQYDFNTKQFPLKTGTTFQRVGYMSLFSPDDMKPYCVFTNSTTGENVAKRGGVFSKSINIALSDPFSFTSLKVTPDEAERIFGTMQKLGTERERKLYIRFRFRVQSVLEAKQEKRNGGYFQTILGGEIISIDLFYDKDLTQWLMSVPLR